MSSQSKDQTTSTEPPKYLQPYLKDAANQAARLYRSQPAQYYPGSQYVDFAPQTEDALAMTEQRAREGSDVTRAANEQNTATIRGDYLYGGQGFNAAFDAAARKIMPQVESSFSNSGRLRGSGLADVAKTQALSDSFAMQYGAERDNQMRATAMAPMLAQQDYFDYQQLADVGRGVENLAQNRLNENVDRYNYYQNMPEQRLAQYVGLLNNSYPGSSTTTPRYTNPGAGAAGGALSGASMGSSFGPWGTAIGAGVGGLLGYYGSR